MKTLATILTTTIVTLGIVGGLLLHEGIVTIQQVEETHTSQTYIDGELVSDKEWNNLMGYQVNIDVVDGTYIGR